MKRIYLDANGSCPPGLGSQEKSAQLLPFAGSPSSFHGQGRALRAIIDDARDFVAKSLNARPASLFSLQAPQRQIVCSLMPLF